MTIVEWSIDKMQGSPQYVISDMLGFFCHHYFASASLCFIVIWAWTFPQMGPLCTEGLTLCTLKVTSWAFWNIHDEIDMLILLNPAGLLTGTWHCVMQIMNIKHNWDAYVQWNIYDKSLNIYFVTSTLFLMSFILQYCFDIYQLNIKSVFLEGMFFSGTYIVQGSDMKLWKLFETSLEFHLGSCIPFGEVGKCIR